MPSSLGFQEMVIVLVIALIVLGPRRLPEVARSLGSGLREFKHALAQGGRADADTDEDVDDDDQSPELVPPRI